MTVSVFRRKSRSTGLRRASAVVIAAVVVGGVLLPITPASATPSDAPGAPGASATWRNGDKEGVGTSVNPESKVWFTLNDGTLSETYYPAADTPNVRDLSFVVSDGSTFSQRETDDTQRVVELADPTSLTYRQTTTDNAGRWKLTKTYVTDPARATVLIDISFQALTGGPYKLYTVYDPSLAGTAGTDTGMSVNNAGGAALVASDTHLGGTPVASALVSSAAFTSASTGYVGGASDPWTDLSDNHALDGSYPNAGPGNIVQIGEIPTSAATTKFTVALGFGADTAGALATANASLGTPFTKTAASYQGGWQKYLKGLKRVPRQLTGDLATQYNVSLMTVKAHEDKTYRGAFIASLTLPWGQVVNADGAGGGGGGYHFVWARDLYHQVTSLLAAGDTAAAERAVTWLFEKQQLPDGHFPQNSHVDGTPDQNNIQLDETAFPIILAWQTKRNDRKFYQDHIRKAADYLVAAGPTTAQERWETEEGYSPSTMASQIAALTAAADIADRNHDDAAAAIYQGTADSWQRQTEKWMYTTTGGIGGGQYYIRIEGDGDPNDGDTREYSDGAGILPERDIADAGFLELVRLGVKAPADPFVAGSLPETDASLATDTPNGPMWHRYTHDGYGEHEDGRPWSFPANADGTGRLWPLLSGERGEYELANGRDALPYLQTMHNAANAGYMIPEQAWDVPDPTSYGHVFGEGTGSAAPLAWAMAQYVRLAQGIANGSPVETPKVVSKRYAKSGRNLTPPALTVTSPATGVQTATDRSYTITGTTDAKELYIDINGTKQEVKLRGPGTKTFTATVTLPDLRNAVTIVAVSARGGTATENRTVLAYGDRLGGLTDPVGDDNGPGSYVYPTDGAFNPGAFDLTGFDVYRDGENLRLVTGLAGQINNPWGGNGMSVQRLNVYIKDPAAGTTPTPALPGTNMNTAGPWSRAVVADGRYPSGVYGPDGAKVADIDLQVVQETNQIVVTIPVTALEAVNPATAGYQVSMFGDAEEGEGIGNIRPVYDYNYWNTNALGFVKQYRFGGGAGEIDFGLASKDTDTSDPNAIDIVSGAAAQSTVLDWTQQAPVVAPYVSLAN